MQCIRCNRQIPELRLKALPQTKTCITCSHTSRVAGFPIISGKTTYAELQIFRKKRQISYTLSRNVKAAGPQKE